MVFLDRCCCVSSMRATSVDVIAVLAMCSRQKLNYILLKTGNNIYTSLFGLALFITMSNNDWVLLEDMTGEILLILSKSSLASTSTSGY